MQAYPRERVLRLLSLPEGRLRYWERLGLAPRKREYTLGELSQLRRAARLNAQGLPVSALLQSDFRLRWVGCVQGRAVVREPDGLVEVGSRQGIFDFEAQPVVLELVAASRADHEECVNDLLAEARFEEAHDCLERRVRAQPWSATARYNLAVVLEQMGCQGDSQRQLELALGLDPQHAESHYNLARLLEMAGRERAARWHWERFLRLEPDSEWAHQVRSFLGLAAVASSPAALHLVR